MSKETEKAIEQLQAKLDGYEGAILEPLQEKYKIVCDENLQLQASLDKAEAENKRLYGALGTFGRHLEKCPAID
ncbi:hypothetical protein LCGC14_1703120, partial [marine sediment metagenome]